jgi:hypothetical protein
LCPACPFWAHRQRPVDAPTTSVAAIAWELDRSSLGGWFERSETFEHLGQLLPTFLEKLFSEMI